MQKIILLLQEFMIHFNFEFYYYQRILLLCWEIKRSKSINFIMKYSKLIIISNLKVVLYSI
jgi:hypothetical protein